MHLKRSRDGLKAILFFLVAALLLGSMGWFIWYLVAHGTLRLDIFFLLLAMMGTFFLAIALIIAAVFIGGGIGLLVRVRMFQAVARNDRIATPEAVPQPDRTLALRDGETLTLDVSRASTDQANTRKSGRSASSAVGITLMMLLLAGFGVGLVLYVLPAFDFSDLLGVVLDSSPQGSEVGTASPSMSDWVALAYPVALALLFPFFSLASVFGSTPRAIIADDQGVTMVSNRGKARSIAWRDITLFLHPVTGARALPTGGYLLWGPERGINISIPNPKSLNAFGGLLALPEKEQHAYLADVDRLLATIATRSYAPLRLYTGSAGFFAWVRRRAPVMAIDLEDAEAAPVASAPLQPSERAIAAVTFPAAVTLKERRPVFWPTLLESLIWSALLLAFGAIFVNTTPYFVEETGAALVPMLIGGAAFCIALGVLLASARRHDASQAVVADSFGIQARAHSLTSQNNKRPYVAWSAVRAWVVLPGDPSQRQPARYILFAVGAPTREMPNGVPLKLSWKEPPDARLAGRGVKGDRRAAYREQAERLHALIAARTGLLLREFIPGATPATTLASAPASPLQPPISF